MSDNPDSPQPIIHRARRKLQKYTPDYTVCVIYHGDNFSDIRGPGYFSLNPFTERIGETISTKPRAYPLQIENLMTRDPIRITLAGKVSFTFDPREGDVTTIARLVKIPEAALTNALGETLQELIFKALRARVSELGFEEMQNGASLAQMEETTVNALGAMEALQTIGIRDVRVLFTHAILPPEIETRLNEAAQRRYNARVTREIEQPDLLRSLIVELVEKASRGGSVEQLFNFTEAVNTLRQMEVARDSRAMPAPPSETIDGQVVKPVPDEPPAPPPPPAEPAKSKPKRGANPISPSYLDPDL
jgi:hypothetical protein